MITMRWGEAYARFIPKPYGHCLQIQRRDIDGRFAEAVNEYLVPNNPVLRTKLQIGIPEERII